MIVCTLATDSWMILRLGQGSKCYIGLFSYDCPTLGLSGDFDTESKCYEYSTGVAVAQIFAFVALTFSGFFLITLELVYFCKWKIIKRKTAHLAGFMSAFLAWMLITISGSIYTGMAWNECFSQILQNSNGVRKDPGYSFVATWLIFTLMILFFPFFIIIDKYKTGAKVSRKKKNKKGKIHDQL
jgi:hypothetical protein